ncbi:MAG: glycosyltransferase [Bacteroidales bacterium]|nr:glycosyltransferase [Bacteroidales bacterium]
MEEQPKVSVIVPIYGTEKWIERCAKSLLNQTLENFEIIFVNDKTQDNSIAILKKCISENHRTDIKITIADNDLNLGLAETRMHGVRLAKGEYIMHCDSDDRIELPTIENMYQQAKKTSADIVWADFYLDYDTEQKLISEDIGSTCPKDVVHAMLSTKIWWSMCTKIYRREFYLQNIPSETKLWRNGGEDMLNIRLFYNASITTYLPMAGYHYNVQNQQSMTRALNIDKIKSYIDAIDDVENFIMSKPDGHLFENELNYMKVWLKQMAIYQCKNRHQLRWWKNLYRSANKVIYKNKNYSLTQRLISLCAAHGIYFPALLRNKYFVK